MTVSIPRLIVAALIALALVWVLMVLASSSLLGGPTSGSGERRPPAKTLTTPEP